MRYVSPLGVMVTVAGTVIGGILAGSGSNFGTGGSITSARLNNPMGVLSDNAGGVLVPDYWNNAIRRVLPSGRFTNYISGVGNPAHIISGKYRESR